MVYIFIIESKYIQSGKQEGSQTMMMKISIELQ